MRAFLGSRASAAVLWNIDDHLIDRENACFCARGDLSDQAALDLQTAVVNEIAAHVYGASGDLNGDHLARKLRDQLYGRRLWLMEV